MRYRGWLYASVIFYILENCWFGWNSEPSCTAERVCDFIVLTLLYVAMFKWTVITIASKVVDKVKSELKLITDGDESARM